MSTVSYGAWPSPISVDVAFTGTRSLGHVRADATGTTWLESRPEQDGRQSLMHLAASDGTITELTPAPMNIRTRIMEYGGCPYAIDQGQVVLVDDQTRSLLWYRHDPQLGRGAWVTLVHGQNSTLRFGDLRLDAERQLVLAVTEDVGDGKAEPTAAIVAIDLSRSPARPVVLVEGATFYADPELSGDGRLAWCQWDHPNMPWDTTSIWTGRLYAETLSLSDIEPLVELDEVSALHPRWIDGPSGNELVLVTDRSGYWNWDRATTDGLESITADALDHEQPLWTLGDQTWQVEPSSGRLLGTQHHNGATTLVEVDLGTGQVLPIDAQIEGLPVIEVDSVAVAEHGRYAIVATHATSWCLVRLDEAAPGGMQVLRDSGLHPDPDTISIPEPLWVPGRHGQVHAWFYPPHLAGIEAPDGERPPLIVMSHGGPTSATSAAYRTKVQYWTSRGFAVVDVNYGGSTGFGREYRNRLRGQWGIVDVDDCRSVVEYLASQGLVDPQRVSITGGSAGGYTTLQSLVSTDTYTAGVSNYGIGDLMLLASDTHKFESRYPESLVGPLPQSEQRYRDRSPIAHVDQLATPMLINQGTEDKVVPPNQAETMAKAVHRAGQPVVLQWFEGEGHGWRQLASAKRALRSEQAFYTQLWQLPSTEELPELDWM